MERIIRGVIQKSRMTYGYDTFGIIFQTQSGRTLTVIDVDPRREVAEVIAKRLQGEWVDDQQLRYLIEDLLVALYDGAHS